MLLVGLEPRLEFTAGKIAQIGGRSWDMAATIDRPTGGGGVLYATGNENSGLSVFVKDEQ